MKMLLTLFIYSFLLVSCGANKMKSEAVIRAVGVNGLACSCISNYMPVCSVDGPNKGNTYDNLCIANCMGATQTSAGHCSCSSSLMVCVDNATTIDECTALKNGSNITKFIPCDKTPL
jgi:hypothetical protein